MNRPDILGINKWIAEAGIKLVTGIHITKSDKTGLGLRFDSDENLKDEMACRQSEDNSKKNRAESSNSRGHDEMHDASAEHKNKDDNVDENEHENQHETEYKDEDESDSAFEEFEEFNEDSDFEDDDEKIVALVPSELVLSANRIRELAETDKTLQSWLSVDPGSEKNVLHLGLLYLWKFAANHPWTGYFDYLPKEIDLPYTFHVKKMEELDSSNVSLGHSAMKKRLEIEKSYERFLKRAVTEETLTLQEWLLPHAWISSRGITHPITSQTCLIPILDLCNHSSTDSNARYDADDEGNFELRLIAPADDIGNSDLLLNYGDRGTGEFFFNYGFIPDDRNDEGFDEVFKVFNPSVEDIRNILDLSRRKDMDLSEEKRHELAIQCDVFIEFFAPLGPQVLRIIRFPKMVEPDESKRYRFHNNLIMALASSDHIEFHGSKDQNAVLFLNNTKLTPTNIFDVVRQMEDPSILAKARALVVKLCENFYAQVSNPKTEDPLIRKLAKAEASLFKSYADTNR